MELPVNWGDCQAECLDFLEFQARFTRCDLARKFEAATSGAAAFSGLFFAAQTTSQLRNRN